VQEGALSKAWAAQGMSRVLVWIAISAIPVAWLEVVSLVAGSSFTWGGIVARWALVALLLSVGSYTQPRSSDETHSVWPWSSIVVAAAGSLAVIYYILSGATAAAWVIVGTLFVLLLGLEKGLTRSGSICWRWAVRAAVIVLGGAVPVALAQLETRFSEEEFFVALQGLALSVFTALLMLALALMARRKPGPARAGLRFRRLWLGLTVVIVTLVGLGATIRAYQRSFYPPEAPPFEGISEDSPFLCGTAPSDPRVYSGEQTFQQLLAQVAGSPNAGPPEYGMLTLGTGEQKWAAAFRESILKEAADRRFTEAAHTVKSAQYLAALRIYYLSAVTQRFPDLFAPDEIELLQSWAADINRRALTVELVDWMYGLAFTKWPEGPYENQENGAGLLALLEAGGLAAPELSAANQDYLQRNPRGWTARFRNTDDAFVYQRDWIMNAYFQSLYTDETLPDSVARSFDWLLLQALPDGAPLSYNHPSQPSLASIAYFGAYLSEDPRLVWLAGRALESAQSQGKPLPAQPGVEQAVVAEAKSPTQGSCLLFAGSGLPNQVGPLAPDKIVFRDGWSAKDTYLLLNLRFTGWHRYKATNTVTLVYQGGPLASDLLEGVAFDWLPRGRSVFRDKRIPRENLNGLLVPRQGLDAVLYSLTGFGGPWAQDPPPYAEVHSFETGETLDWSHTRLEDWESWQHDRRIFFYHDGPLVVVDSADGQPGSRAALVWHLLEAGPAVESHINLGSEREPAEVVLMGYDAARDDQAWSSQRTSNTTAGDGFQDVLYYPETGGQLRTVTVFLMDRWVGARVEVNPELETIEITQVDAQVTLRLPEGW
jgi:hypothetical protein